MNKSRPPVSVLVCTRDRPEFLGDCLRSIDALLEPSDELILVEQGDSASAAALAPLRCSWRHIRDADQLEADRAALATKTGKINRGIAIAANDVVLLSDDDCRVPTGWTDAMANAFDESDVGVVFGTVRGMTHVGDESSRPSPGVPPIAPWQYSHGASMAVRRTAIIAVGGFDERLGPGSRSRAGEEPDIILRLQRRGWKCRIAAGEPVTHLDWRDEGESHSTLLNYERGSGAWLGKACRRAPIGTARLLVFRLHYQTGLFRDRKIGPRFGLRALLSFAYGFALGLAMGDRRWVPDVK